MLAKPHIDLRAKLKQAFDIHSGKIYLSHDYLR